MPDRHFRLQQIHQRLDESLRHALKARRPDPLRLWTLRVMKMRVKDLLHRVARMPRTAG